MVRLAVLGGFVALAATLVSANSYSIQTCLCETKRRVFHLYDFRYHLDGLNQTFSSTSWCSDTYHRIIHWKDNLTTRKECFYGERICAYMGPEGAEICVMNGFPRRGSPNANYYNVWFEDQWDCTEECRRGVPYWFKGVTSMCNSTGTDGALTQYGKDMYCGTQHVSDK